MMVVSNHSVYSSQSRLKSQKKAAGQSKADNFHKYPELNVIWQLFPGIYQIFNALLLVSDPHARVKYAL